MRISEEHSFLPAQNVRPLRDFDVSQFESLKKIGIGLDANSVRKMMAAMDTTQPLVTTASISTPIQFLQNWLPGFVFVITQARKIDDLIGISTSGSWEDEEVIQGVLERTGSALPYGDYTNVPLSSWNTNFEKRSIVRFEQGMKIGNLEAARSSRMQVDDAGMKREAAALNLEIARNSVGFVGFNPAGGRTFGILNDPGLPAYVTVSNGASGLPQWSTKTFLEICKDIRSALVSLRNGSGDTIDPETVNITLGIATIAVDWLSTTSDFGISVRDWLRQAYPRVRVVSAPQFNGANGGANVFYLFADNVSDQSTDDGRVFVQVVPTKFQVMGVQQMAKGYEEDYSNATAGVMLKRPYGVVRRSGI